MKDIQSDKAVNYIINQIKKLEKNVDEYKYEINSIELELKSICNKMNEVLNSGDKTQDLFTSTNCDKYIEKEYKNNLIEEDIIYDMIIGQYEIYPQAYPIIKPISKNIYNKFEKENFSIIDEYKLYHQNMEEGVETVWGA